jgi:endo-1,4-beta-xylanase
MSRVPVNGQNFTQAFNITTKVQPPNEYDIRLMARSAVALSVGELVRVVFKARTVNTSGQKGSMRFVIERASSPYTKSAYIHVPLTGDWRKFEAVFRIVESYNAGEASIFFSVGQALQTIEIGDVSITRVGGSGYLGKEPDAPWRQAAAERIDRIRKANLQVRVTDSAGNTIPGAQVRIRMKRHKFGFGSAVDARTFTSDSADGTKYREVIKNSYSRVVLENDLKWGNWERDKLQDNNRRTLETIKRLRDQNIEVRGHCLVWPSWRNTPGDLEALGAEPQKLKRRVDDHIVEEVSALKGQLLDWDVINEPYDNHDIIDILGRQEMVHWFNLARRNDPAAKLYINDYSILSSGGFDFAHQDHYEETINYLLRQGAPLDGIGLQSHFDGNLTSPDRLIEILDRFAKFGKDLQSTEFDIDISDEQLQADYLRDFMTVLFSHPSVTGIVMWGFWEGKHWRPRAALYRRDWTIKPNGIAWNDLVLNRWWTNADGLTDKDGSFDTRGFLGDYEIEVTKDGVTKRESVHLDGQRLVNVRLEQSFNLNLEKGWNLISLPLMPDDTKRVNLLAGAMHRIQAIYGYSADRYVLNPTDLLPGAGYWVYMSDPAQVLIKGRPAPKTVQLNAGWNLTGYNSTKGVEISSSLTTLMDKIVAIYGFEKERYVIYPDEKDELKRIEPGKGYWIYAKETFSWKLE